MQKTLWYAVACILVGWLAGVVFKLFEEVIHFLLIPAGIVAAIAIFLRRRSGSGPGPEPATN